MYLLDFKEVLSSVLFVIYYDVLSSHVEFITLSFKPH